MQFIKTICVIVVLGALAYGAYTTLTGKPKTDPPVETANWDSPPRIELPGGSDVGANNGALAPTGPAGGSAPKYGGDTSGAARITPGGPLTPPPFSTAAPATNNSAAATPGATGATPSVPAAYPTTNAIPGPFDGGGAVHLVSSTATSPAASSTTAPGAVPASATAAVPPVNAADALTKGQAALAQQNYLLALDEFSKCFDNPGLAPQEASRVQELLDQLAGMVIYSREHLVEPPHVVAAGETIESIAAKHNVSPGLLAKINGGAYLAPGAQLKTVKGPFDAVVDKGHGKLTLFVDGMYAGSFPLAPGLDFPDGNYTVDKLSKGLTLGVGNGAVSQPVNMIMLSGGVSLYGSDETALPTAGDPRTGVRGLSLRDADDICDILTVGSKVVVRK